MNKKTKKQLKIFSIFVVSILVFVLLINLNFSGKNLSVTGERSDSSSSEFGGGTREGGVPFSLLLDTVYDRTCTPEAGYNKCFEYQYSYTYGQADARPTIKLQVYDPTLGNPNKWILGDGYFKWKVTGDDTYLYYNPLSNWNTFYSSVSKCDGSGCYNGQHMSNTGQIKLVSSGETKTDKCPKIVAYDYNKNTASNGEWAWAYAYYGFGWSDSNGDGLCSFVSKECLKNEDCNSNEFCEETGYVNPYTCKSKNCVIGETKTDSTGYYVCEHYAWAKKECKNGEEKCSNNNNYQCINEKWINKGPQIGKCNVICIKESDCGIDENMGESFCSDNKIKQSVKDYSCSLNKCSNEVKQETLEDCEFKCNVINGNPACVNQVCSDGETICSNSQVLDCQNNQYVAIESCDYGCLNLSESLSITSEPQCKSFVKNYFTTKNIIIGVSILFGLGLVIWAVIYFRRRR